LPGNAYPKALPFPHAGDSIYQLLKYAGIFILGVPYCPMSRVASHLDHLPALFFYSA
jgi:hypothetical protein